METTSQKDEAQTEVAGPGHEDALQEILRTARRVTMTNLSAREQAASPKNPQET